VVQKVSPPVVTRRAMNFSERCVVFRDDPRPVLSVDASTLQSNRKLWSSFCGYFVLYFDGGSV
jgi:hypothetical protein